MRTSDTVASMWAEFIASGTTAAEAAESAEYTSWHFGTPGAMADELVELVLDGSKRATAGALWAYEQDGDPIPRVGDYSVITDGSDVARCIIKTTRVEIVPFEDVTAEFAATEGEGDGSLEYWLDGHWRYFGRELRAFGREPAPDMPVVCECFEVVYAHG